MVRTVSTTPFLPGALCRFRHSPEPSRSRYQPAASSLPSVENRTLKVISPNTLGQWSRASLCDALLIYRFHENWVGFYALGVGRVFATARWLPLQYSLSGLSVSMHSES